MRYLVTCLSVVCALVVMGASPPTGTTAVAYRKLTSAEIKARVMGMEITDQAHFSEQYMRDGTVKLVTMGRKVVARWLIKQGQLCIEAPRAADSRCAEIWAADRKVQLRVPGDPVPYDVIIQKQQPRD